MPQREAAHQPKRMRSRRRRRFVQSRSTSARGVARTSAGDRDQRRPASVRRTYRVRIVFAPTGAIRTPRNGPSRGRMRGSRRNRRGPRSPRHIWVSERVVAPARRPSRCRAVALATAVAASLASLPHVLDRPPPEKRGVSEFLRTAPALPPVTCGRGGRTAGGQRGPTLRRRLARRRGRVRRGRTPRGGRRGRRSSLRSR